VAGELRAKDCYIGQRVFWVMWFDQQSTSETRKLWYGYRDQLSPDIVSSVVERLPGNGSIMLRHFGRASNIYSCEIDAVRCAYELFCSIHLVGRYCFPKCSLGEASRVLRELAELEFGIHAAVSMERNHGR
jgi:hypothetical protein